jgi:Tol biopolymer transport system component
LRWRTRDGRPAGTVVAPAQYRGFALSPDGRQLLLARMGRSGGADLWLREIGSGRETQLTFDGAAFAPQWSPDGRRIAFSGYANQPPPNLFIKDLTVQGAAAQAGRVPTPEFASSWGRDGAIITVRTQDAANGHDLWMRSGPAAVAERLSVNTSSYEFQGRLSPDGRWLAYVSDRNGRDEVWIARMPEAADPQRVSAGGATMPEWSADGRELLYVSDERALMSVALDPAADRWLDRPRLVLPLPQLIDVDREVWPTVNAYVVAADGRIVLAEREPDPEAPPISIIANWPALMRP